MFWIVLLPHELSHLLGLVWFAREFKAGTPVTLCGKVPSIKLISFNHGFIHMLYLVFNVFFTCRLSAMLTDMYYK